MHEIGKNWDLSIVVVTYNRAEVLRRSLSSLARMSAVWLKKIYVYDNASTDDTPKVVRQLMLNDDRIQYKRFDTNIGGAGGFSEGVKEAYLDGAEWIGLMDDDLLIEQRCLEVLSKYAKLYECMILVRQNDSGELAEYAALEYNLKNPLILNPKTKSVMQKFRTRGGCPEIFPVQCASFEGFFIKRNIVSRVGYPTKEFFIYGDDFDYCLRINKINKQIVAVRDAVGTRMIPYSKSKFGSWKTYYIWRNFFILHFLHGQNIFVRLKPYFLFCGLSLVNIFLVAK